MFMPSFSSTQSYALGCSTTAGVRRDPATGYRLRLNYKTSTNRLRVRIAEAIASYLGKIGIDVRIQTPDFGTFFDRILHGDFQLYTLTWTGLTEPDILYYAFASAATPPAGANRGGLRDPLVDELVTRARQTLDRKRRRELYRRVQRRLAEIRPYAVLWNNDTVIARRRTVPRFTPYPDGSLLFVADLAPAPTSPR